MHVISHVYTHVYQFGGLCVCVFAVVVVVVVVVVGGASSAQYHLADGLISFAWA